MNIVILGSGAMGLLYYKQLWQAHNVSIRFRNDNHIEDVKLTFTNIFGQSSQLPIRCANTQELNTADIILSTVKAYDVVQALTNLKLNPSIPIILMHNGMGTIESLSNKLKNPLLPLLTTQASKKLAVRHIQHTGNGVNQLGYINKKDKLLTKKLFYALETSIPGMQLSNDIRTLQWKKLAVNCAINPLTAIFNINNGLLDNKLYKSTIKQITNELITVGKCEGLNLDYKQLLNTIDQVIHKTKHNSSSMRQDVINHRTTEIEFINGYIVKMGLKHNIETPVNEMMIKQITDINYNYAS